MLSLTPRLMAQLSSFEAYLASQISPEARAVEMSARNERLSRFPHAVMVLLTYPELDFANRWCWQRFGPEDGECTQRHSEYPVCTIAEKHTHSGQWRSFWHVKTDYNFGFNEWYFAAKEDCDRFRSFVKEITWGENYPADLSADGLK